MLHRAAIAASRLFLIILALLIGVGLYYATAELELLLVGTS